MRKAVLISICILLIAGPGVSQRKSSQPKAKPKNDLERYLDREPPDEVLFTQTDYDLWSGLMGWRVVARSSQVNGIQTVVSYDPDRVFPVNGTNTKRAWIKFENFGAGMIEFPEGHSLLFDEFDCSGNRWRTLQSSSYDKNGKVNSHSGSKQWSHIVPDSVIESVFGVICLGEGDE